MSEQGEAVAVRKAPEEAQRKLVRHYPDLLATLLALRGVATPEEAERFLEPDYARDTHDPFLLADMDRAVHTVAAALARGARIGIFADYDADGIPGAVVLHDFFARIGYDKVELYIPHRNREGFGLNKKGIDALAARGVTLLITVDCGAGQEEEAAYARARGMEVVITDHHLSPEGRAPCSAMINPNQKGCSYPNKALCGAGVAYKLVQALLARGKWEDVPRGWEKWLLDMVGIATVSDMVSLRDPENRALARFGLRVLRKSPRPGVVRLCRALRISQRHLTEEDIAFSLAPRINAASRMGEPKLALRLLATRDPVEAEAMVAQLNALNQARKGVVAAMTKKVKAKIAALPETPPVIVAGSPQWRPSLVGLVASSVAEAYHRPAFVWGEDENGTIKGSCRAPKGQSVHALMQALPDGFFTEYGGHAGAGGFSTTPDKVHFLERELSTALLEGEGKREAPRPAVDAVLPVERVTWDLHRMLSRLAPFGQENPAPLFCFSGVAEATSEWFGKTKEHLKILLRGAEGGEVRGIRFFAKETPLAPPYLGVVEVSRFGGREELRVRF